MRFRTTALTLITAALLLAGAARAQAPAATQSQAPEPPFTKSFLFSPAEIAAIERALSGTVSGTAVLTAADSTEPIPQRRVIALSGVVWRGPADWIAWINGKKVTPKDLLPEIIDIKVERDHVSLKWFDRGINGVISISLRPHQTYDIVTGVLLPG